MDTQKLSRIEGENTSHKVYCDECRWTLGDRCFHPNARAYDYTPRSREPIYALVETRNRDNNCPDFAFPSLFDQFRDFMASTDGGLLISLGVVLALLVGLCVFLGG